MFKDLRHYVYGLYLHTTGKRMSHSELQLKKTLPGSDYRLVNTVKLSLQSGRNIELRTCVILIIFSCFWNTTDLIVYDKKKNANICDMILFEGLSFQNTLIRNYYALFFYLSQDKVARKIYLSDRFYIQVG
jgi:hypothetical protein